MPTYDYQCRTCRHTVEVIHGMTEQGPTACEVCGGPLRRVLFPAGIIFKGSGFYRNDARAAGSGANSSTKRPAAEDGSSSKSGGSSPRSDGSTLSGTDAASGGSTATDAPKPPAPASTGD